MLKDSFHLQNAIGSSGDFPPWIPHLPKRKEKEKKKRKKEEKNKPPPLLLQ